MSDENNCFALYEKLIMLEAVKRVKDEENEIYEVVSEKFKQYETAYSEYVSFYSQFTRLLSSARSISAILKISSKLENVIISTNMITKDDTKKLSIILRCPYFHYMPQNTIDLLRQSITGLCYDKKMLHDIYYYIKRNKYLKETVDGILIGKENALRKCIPSLVDMIVLSFDVE